ncbi:MAG: CocE/NonD family hydrolase [Bacteroidetes bacterium]|nr:CocE/NonD family hydrolase [Bacteroidota bacterium]
MIRRFCFPLLVVTLVLLCSRPAFSQLRAQETDIPMRDGRTLAADVYVNPGSRAKPVILVQTPYNKALYRLNFSLYRQTAFPLDSSRYQYVIADWRGFYASKDADVPGYDRGLDGYDIVEWIASQPWCNGKVATHGGSALGMIQFQTARHRPPHLVCAAPMIKDIKTNYFDYYYGGVLRREHVETLGKLGFAISIAQVTSRPVEDAFWKGIEQQSDISDEIGVPMLLVSGWFDHFPDDVIQTFEDLRAYSDPAVRAQHRLIMGPWTHSGVDREEQGDLTFPNAANVAREAALAFFDYYLNGAKNGWPLTPRVRYYQMGENEWRDCERWSDLGASEHRLFLADGGRLLRAPEDGGAESDLFRTDPRDPSPSHGAARFDPFDPSVAVGPVDIRDVVESRGDVLLYTTDVLEEDLRVTGSGTLRLSVRCDVSDADFSVRLCDVFPDGRSIILTDAIHRARFREGTDREVLMTPGSVYTIDIQLQELAHTFLEGHRLRVVIGGADYPRFDVNLHNGGEMYTAGDTLVASSEVLHTIVHPSMLLLETDDAGTSVSPTSQATAFRIEHVWPQPLSAGGTMQISYRAEPGRPSHIRVSDLLGRTLRVLDGGSAGSHTLRWDGCDAEGRLLSPGIYLLTLTGNGQRDLRPVTILR